MMIINIKAKIMNRFWKACVKKIDKENFTYICFAHMLKLLPGTTNDGLNRKVIRREGQKVIKICDNVENYEWLLRLF